MTPAAVRVRVRLGVRAKVTGKVRVRGESELEFESEPESLTGRDGGRVRDVTVIMPPSRVNAGFRVRLPVFSLRVGPGT